MRVAAYIRVSSDGYDQVDSYELQERYFTGLLSGNPSWINAGIYSDYARSGTSASGRPGFQRLLRHCSEGKIDRIITKSISRFARNTTDFLTALKVLNENHVTVLFEKEGLDSADPSGQFVMTTLGAIAQEEARATSENILWGNQRRFANGQARNYAIYGYRFVGEGRNRDVEIVEEEAQVVRWIFQAVAAGQSFASIARKLNQDNAPPPRHRGNKRNSRDQSDVAPGWTGSKVGEIVRLERYVGDVLAQKTYVSNYLDHKSTINRGEKPQYLIRDHHPAIVDRELYDQVQARLKTRSRVADKADYPFSGRLVCAHCGKMYNALNNRPDALWGCPTSQLRNGKNLCTAKPMKESALESMFRSALTQRFPMEDRFLSKLCTRLRIIQNYDNVERDRAYLKRQDGDKQELLEHMEEYWRELDEDRELREKAILWMENLKDVEQFMRELIPYAKAFVLSITVHSPDWFTLHWFDDTTTEYRKE